VRNAAISLVIAMLVSACGSSPAPTPAPTAAPPTSVAAPSEAVGPWAPADVVQPDDVTAGQSLAPGVQCHPCHFLAENQFFGVAAGQGSLIAVGVQSPPGQGIAFSSTDGRTWNVAPGLTTDAASSAVATASDGSTTVIVGANHDGATSWAKTSGGTATWTQAPKQTSLLVPYVAGAMTSVTAFDGGFAAGGYRDDPLHNTALAAVWRSTDGLTWQLDDANGLFAGGRVLGIAATGGTLVAVGTNGDPNYGPTGAWRWTQATGWQRASVEPDTSGAMRAVTATPTGFVAVGLNGHDTGAAAWTSKDGLTWTAVADQPAFHYFELATRMQAVTTTANGTLVVGGWRSDAGKGSAVAWTSADDGLTWQGPTWEDGFSGGQITGVAVLGSTVVAVGRTGYPDWNRASAWLMPAP
jgi:hypothetical protein